MSRVLSLPSFARSDLTIITVLCKFEDENECGGRVRVAGELIQLSIRDTVTFAIQQPTHLIFSVRDADHEIL